MNLNPFKGTDKKLNYLTHLILGLARYIGVDPKELIKRSEEKQANIDYITKEQHE
jgi:hypothetical protein